MTPSIQSTKEWLRTYDRRSNDHRKARSKIINMLAKRKHTLALKIKEKLKRNQELSQNDRVYVLRLPRKQHKDYILSKKYHGLLDATQVSELDSMFEVRQSTAAYLTNTLGHSEKSPLIMFRTTTLNGKDHTNGFTTPNLSVPSANLMKDFEPRRGIDDTSWIRTSITDIPLQELRPMLGEHLLWLNRTQDELLSWTISYLFAIIHLYLRHLNGQGIGCISMINRTRASHPEEWYVEQLESQVDKPAKFYSANDLCDHTGVYNDHEWPCRKHLPNLHPRKTNHEYITHAVVKHPDNDRLQQAEWGDLVAAGLFELVPELKVCFFSRAAGLYTVLRHIRTSNYNDVRTTTARELAIAQEIAWLHTRLRPGEEKEHSRPNLWILLHALTFHKRTAGDKLLQKLIFRLRYTRESVRVVISMLKLTSNAFLGQDLDENLNLAFGVFPSNLPEMQSLYHLAVDVQAVVGGQPLSALVLTSTYSRVPLPAMYQGQDDAAYDEKSKPRLIKSNNDKYKIGHRCGLLCDCSIWVSTKKRKKVTEANVPYEPEDTDESENDCVETSIQGQISDGGQVQDGNLSTCFSRTNMQAKLHARYFRG
jgi:hypothetical protein